MMVMSKRSVIVVLSVLALMPCHFTKDADAEEWVDKIVGMYVFMQWPYNH